MAAITFRLISKSDLNGTPIKTSNSLKEIWNFIKIHVNEPRSWLVEECKGIDLVDQCCAFHLIENYKKEENVPMCISDTHL